jgi:hypothetical protein
MNYNEKLNYIKDLFERSRYVAAWELYKKTLTEYVTSVLMYRRFAKWVENEYGYGTTFLSKKNILFSNNYTPKLFHNWIADYNDTFKKFNNTYIGLSDKNKPNLDQKKIFLLGNIIKLYLNGYMVENFQ